MRLFTGPKRDAIFYVTVGVLIVGAVVARRNGPVGFWIGVAGIFGYLIFSFSRIASQLVRFRSISRMDFFRFLPAAGMILCAGWTIGNGTIPYFWVLVFLCADYLSADRDR